MKARLADMEEEAAKLKEAQERARRASGQAGGPGGSGGEGGAGAGGGGGGGGASSSAAPSGDASIVDADAAAAEAAREEADGRSVYVGSVEYAVTPEELQMHFQSCGTVNRVTILTDRQGNPKGFAYVEFLEKDAVANACLLDGSELHGRAIKVHPKRTNVPGMRRGRGRGRGRGIFVPAFAMPWMLAGAFPGGYAPRGRGRGRGRRGGAAGAGGGAGYTPY